MPSVPERLFTAFIQACAIVVAAVPLAAAGTLSWIGVSHALASRSLPGAGGLAATAAFTVAAAAAAAVIGGSLGIGCALAAEELAPSAIRGAIEAAVAFLGVVPAVAFGWFAVVCVAPLAAAQPLGSATQFAAAAVVLAAFARAVGEATALQILFASLAAYGMVPAATTASWIFATATAAPTADTAAALSFAALALLIIGSGCGFIVAREYRGAQWA